MKIKLIAMLLLAFVFSIPAFGQTPDPVDKWEVGFGYTGTAPDRFSFDAVQDPQGTFLDASTQHGVRVHGSYFFGDGPIGVTTEGSITKQGDVSTKFVGMGLTVKLRKGFFRPYLKGTAGFAQQNDVILPPGQQGISFHSQSVGFHVAAGVELKPSRRFGWNFEVGGLLAGFAKGGDIDRRRNNLTWTTGPVFHF